MPRTSRGVASIGSSTPKTSSSTRQSRSQRKGLRMTSAALRSSQLADCLQVCRGLSLSTSTCSSWQRFTTPCVSGRHWMASFCESKDERVFGCPFSMERSLRVLCAPSHCRPPHQLSPTALSKGALPLSLLLLHRHSVLWVRMTTWWSSRTWRFGCGSPVRRGRRSLPPKRVARPKPNPSKASPAKQGAAKTEAKAIVAVCFSPNAARQRPTHGCCWCRTGSARVSSQR